MDTEVGSTSNQNSGSGNSSLISETNTNNPLSERQLVTTDKMKSSIVPQKPRRRRIRSELDRLLSDEGTRNMLRGLKKATGKQKQATVTTGLFRNRMAGNGGGKERGATDGRRRGRGLKNAVLGKCVVRTSAIVKTGPARGRSRSGSPGKGKAEVKEVDEDRIDPRYVNICKRNKVAWITVIGSSGEVKEEKEEQNGSSAYKKVDGAFGVKILNSIECAFRVLEQDDSISVLVLQSSHSKYFCNGIELSELVIPSPAADVKEISEGTAAAKHSSGYFSGIIRAIKTLITTLHASRKLLVASIRGNCVGLGVMILPLFDFVYASDKSMFEVHYNSLGQSPEGIGLLSGLLRGECSRKLTNLIYLNAPLTATEAQLSGLITETLWPARYQEELATRVHSISINANLKVKSKLIIRNLKRPVKIADLWGEFGVVEGQWGSSEFQSRIKLFLSCGAVFNECADVLNGR